MQAHRLEHALILAIIALGAAALPVQAAPQETGWTDLMHSRVRLVRGAQIEAGVYEIGVHIQLDPDWKTYWRMPGDAGLPPQFDFAGSANFAGSEIAWPAPEWFADAFGNSVGYHDEVVFPIRIAAADPARPVRLETTVHYAVCLDICIPASAEFSLDLDELAATPRHAALIGRYRDKVPLPVEAVDGLAVTAVAAVRNAADRIGLVVDIACPDPRRDVALFVEGPDDIYFGRPSDAAGAPQGHKRLFVPVTGADDVAALAGAALNFVVVDGDTSITQPWTLQ